MSLSKTFYNYDKKALYFLTRNIIAIMLIFLFALGTIIGSYLVKENELSCYEIVSEITKNYFSLKANNSLAINFLTSFSANIIFVLAAFNMGLCVVGIPFITLIPIIKGISIGILSGYLYYTYAFTGLGYCALIIYPGAMISIFAIVLSCQLSINASYLLLMRISKNKSTETEGEVSLKIYFVKYIFIFSFIVLASIVDSAVIKLFSNLFRF